MNNPRRYRRNGGHFLPLLIIEPIKMRIAVYAIAQYWLMLSSSHGSVIICIAHDTAAFMVCVIASNIWLKVVASFVLF